MPDHCAFCWLRAVGLDLELVAPLITEAWRAGAEAQLARVSLALPAGVIVGQLRAGPPAVATALVIDRVRELQAVPPSADVAAAMCGHEEDRKDRRRAS